MRREAHRILLLMLAGLIAQPAYARDDAQPPQARQTELTHLVRHDCGACHGLQLTGGLGPPLLPETLRDKPLDGLTQVILRGRPGTAMPGWQPFLTEDEARWLARTLMKGLVDEPAHPD